MIIAPGPSTAFCFFATGVLGIYYELIWPGRILPGVFGLTALVAGCYLLWLRSPAPGGLFLLGAALLLFAVEGLWQARFLAGGMATLLLAAGFLKLFRTAPGIAPALAIPISVSLGIVTTFMAHSARQARSNKTSGAK